MNKGFATKRINRKGAPSFLGLTSTDSAPEPPAPVRSGRDQRRDLITRLLAERPMTLRELMAAGAGTMDQVNGALYTLKKDGTVVKAGERPRASARWGRKTEDLYGLPGGAAAQPSSGGAVAGSGDSRT
ncbi:MAG: hypothetical protein Q8T13_05035 [Acidobacteriota bacterium]|nr:hypothetical protein [Acidobacteriota bacterium]